MNPNHTTEDPQAPYGCRRYFERKGTPCFVLCPACSNPSPESPATDPVPGEAVGDFAALRATVRAKLTEAAGTRLIVPAGWFRVAELLDHADAQQQQLLQAQQQLAAREGWRPMFGEAKPVEEREYLLTLGEGGMAVACWRPDWSDDANRFPCQWDGGADEWYASEVTHFRELPDGPLG